MATIRKVPEKFIIRNSYTMGIFLVLFALVALIIVLASGNQKSAQEGFFLYIMIAIAVFTLFKGLKLIIDQKPKIIISAEGIDSEKAGFVSWECITDERMTENDNSDSSSFFLEFKNRGVDEKIEISYMSLKPKRLAEILPIYRQNYEENTAAHNNL
ncbi:hypothetical protein ACLI1A_02735 [Flavobacterium sp. RHBU_3]|uniref:hypothetical protein n=1 Tax=Flavobacterium sp. RHBU_3 TaxID=3391184 RepID=UPI003985647B